MNSYYDGKLQLEINYDEDDDDVIVLEEEDHFIIDKEVTGKNIENIGDDKMYNEAIHWAVKVLEELNQDERAAFYKV